MSLTDRDYVALHRRLADGEIASDATALAVHELVVDESAIALVIRAHSTGSPNDQEQALAAYTAAIPRTDIVYQFAERALNFMLSRPKTATVPDNGARARLYAWYWGLWGRALVYFYEVTGELRFLDLFVEVYDGLLAVRDDALGLTDEVRGRVLSSWGSPLERGHRSSEVTGSGLITLPVCEFLRLVRERKELAAYRVHHDRYLASVTAALDELLDELVVDPEQGGYFFVPGSNSEEIEALNHSAVYGAALAFAHALTGRDDYRTATVELCRFMRNATTEHPDGSWSWPYEPKPSDMLGRRGEEIWKAGVSVELPFTAYRCGIEYDDGDIEHLALTFLKGAMRDDARLNTWIDPRTDSPLPREGMNLNLPGIAAGFLPLSGQYPAVANGFMAAVTRTPRMFPGAWFDGARHMLFGLGWLLRGRAGLELRLTPAAYANPLEERVA